MKYLVAALVLFLAGCKSRALPGKGKMPGSDSNSPGIGDVLNSQVDMLMWIECLSIIGVAASIAVIFALRTLAPPLVYLGYAAVLFFGVTFALSLGTSVIVPYLPYIVLSGVAILAAGGIFYAYKHIQWSPAEKQGLNDLVNACDPHKITEAAKNLLTKTTKR